MTAKKDKAAALSGGRPRPPKGCLTGQVTFPFAVRTVLQRYRVRDFFVEFCQWGVAKLMP